MSDETNDQRLRSAGELFDELVELSAGERNARLVSLRSADPVLAAAVAELLAADEMAGSFLLTPLADAQPTLISSAMGEDGPTASLSTGDAVGAWRLVRALGAGGMGEVWEVERADGAFQQRAALKLLKRGLDSEDMLRRFRAERQILARLRHPAIAHLYDGGIAPDGRPYYVMELVTGRPLTDAAVARALSVDERLGLFLAVCDAVDAAHRALVVHRDLKPSNVLVSEAGAVKLLDFGIAKVLAADAAEGGTRAWERVMTPAYAAPEQVLGEAVTTATDVYALGVLLFELLTGRLPHERTATSPLQLAEEVTRETVERPSTVVQRADEATARERLAPAERERRARRLRGDLDWIVLHSLAREPERRYPSAAALAADLRRHLEGRPVEARPDSLGYRASRLVRRNKVAVTAAALVVVALLAGTALALWQAREARAQAARAAAESVRARAETERARREATRSDRIAEFLKTMILEANPEARSGAQSPTLLDAVRAGAANIDQGLKGEPELQARMGIFFGDLFITLGDAAESKRLVERAFAVATKDPGVERRTRADAYGSLAHLRYQERNLPEAERLYRGALAELAPRLREAPDDRGALDLEATLHSLLASTLHDLGRADDAIAELQRGLAISERLHGAEHGDVAVEITNLGMIQREAGHLADAERSLRRSFDLHRKLYGAEDARIFFVGTSLGDVLLERGDAAGAFAIGEQSLAAVRAGFGPDDARTAVSTIRLADCRLAQGRLDEAERLAREALAICERHHDDRTATSVHATLGQLAELRDRHDEAVQSFAAAREAAIRHFGPDCHARFAFSIRGLRARARGGEAAAVLAELEPLVAHQRESSPIPAEVVEALHALGETLALAGRPAEAVALLREAVALGEAKLGADRLATASADLELGSQLAASRDAASRAEGRRRIASAIGRLEKLGRGWMPVVRRGRERLAAG